MGSSNTAGGATAARSATSGTTRTKAAPRPGDWMANRQVPNRTSAVGRGFLGSVLLVGAGGALYFARNPLPPTNDAGAWEALFSTVVVSLVGVAVATIFIAVIVGLLIEQYVPPLRAPQGDVSRWLVVLVLGLTLGPASFVVGFDVYFSLSGQSLPDYAYDLSQVSAISILAYLLAELFMGRGKSSTSSR